jgi:molecular chaperone DnaJ
VAAQRGFFAFPQVCNSCRGAGVDLGDGCSVCRGAGVVEGRHEVTVRIPAGIAAGSRLRVRHGGHHSRGGGAAGHLLVEVRVELHPFFEVQGKNLYCEVPIHYPTAVLGGSVEVPTVDGRMVRMNIPAGTQTGSEFRLRHKGVGPEDGRGHQIVRVRIAVPKKLNADQRRILAEYGTALGDTPAGEKSFWKAIADLFE